MKGEILTAGILNATREWTRQRKAEERQSSARSRRATMWKPRRDYFTDACEYYLEGAYMKASGNGQYPANARQVYYAFRGLAQELVGKPLDANYFTQTLLPEYQRKHPDLSWDVAYDDRGHLTEPHSGKMIGLGTLNVRAYNQDPQTLEVKGLTAPLEMVLAEGPGVTYGAFLFIEKEGFMPLLAQMGIAERYDLAIVSTKGMSVTAARALFDHICTEYDIPLLTLHDFDRTGFKIASTLQRDTARYQHTHRISIIDLGLRLEDVNQYNLPRESVTESISVAEQKRGLRKDGATADEITFLIDGRQRVELNAFTSVQFVEWLEGKLAVFQSLGVIKKVMPDADTLERVYRANVAREHFESQAKELADKAWEKAGQVELPKDLLERVGRALDKDPALSWDRALHEIAERKDI